MADAILGAHVNSSVHFVGCAGWSIPATAAAQFEVAGSHLKRYASKFNAVEINSSFYRTHRPSTYQRWRDTVPAEFRFAVKVPKLITHELRLQAYHEPLVKFLDECRHLEPKLGPLLVQLPPSLEFRSAVVGKFFADLRRMYSGNVVCEPRHPSWFNPNVDSMLREQAISRVAADPAVVLGAAVPSGESSLIYVRLHGSPRIYYSAYDDAQLAAWAQSTASWGAKGSTRWCVFDNTAEGAAMMNALKMAQFLGLTS